MEYQVSEVDGSVSIGIEFGETQSQVAVALTTVPGTATGYKL